MRLDAIGDYILFRNVLRFIRESKKYRDAEITVFGNPAWRGIAESFDADCADKWIWADNRNDLFRKGYENLFPYCLWHRRVRKAQAAWRDKFSGKFDEVLSLQAFRDQLLDEFVSGLAPVVVNGWELPQGDSPFVFHRNCSIASALTGEKCNVSLELKVPAINRDGHRVLFFTGASHWTRRWPAWRWRKLREMVPPGFETVVAPTGTTLTEFARLVKSCAAVVSNDTMALHVAAALGVPAVGIVNGVSGRHDFWPYPASLGKKVEVCIPKRIPRLPIPLLGSRLAQYIALSSVSASSVADALCRMMGVSS